MMSSSRWAAIGTYATTELEAFRRWLLLAAAVLSFYDVWLFLPYGTSSETFRAAGYSSLALGTLLAVGVYLLRNTRTRLATALFLMGQLALQLLVARQHGESAALARLSLLSPLTAMLAGRWMGILMALAALGEAVGLQALAESSVLSANWVAIWMALAGLGYLVDAALDTMDTLERDLADTQRNQIDQLRDHQGELNRALKALDEAYVRLQRSNQELRAARHEAEDARVLKERFVANVSHELRTPLNVIVGFAELMYLEPESYAGATLTPEFEDDLRQLYRTSRHLQDLVNDVLDLSRIDAAALPMFREWHDLRDIVREALDTVRPLLDQRHLWAKVEEHGELPLLFLDRTRIRQVLLNLLNNAARYTDAGGITLELSAREDDVLMAVRDTGVGIPPEQLEVIFEEFRQVDMTSRRREGAGLGLAISRRFAELHGGSMWAESGLAEGSVFYVSLPLPWTITEAETLRQIPETPSRAGEQLPVVVVDPDPTFGDMVQRYLDDRQVLAASDVVEAEAVIRREHPGGVLVNLPPDAPAEAWYGNLSEVSERYNVPVIRCSIPSPSWMQRGDGTGLDAVLIKPVSQANLMDTLARVAPSAERILVVDDSRGFLRLMTRLLEGHNGDRRVYVAATGEQGLELAHAERPDLVLLDMVLPGIDGFEVLERLRAEPELAGTRVVGVTATDYVHELLQHAQGHFSVHQTRGIPTSSVFDVVKRLLATLWPAYSDETPDS
jgi:signal transduction histidine kinase/CheY-like chemotaxis protein